MSPLAKGQVKDLLPASCTFGESGRSAASMSSTGSSGSYDASISSSASAAAYRSLATTAATISPAYRTVSTAIGGGVWLTESLRARPGHGGVPLFSAQSGAERNESTPGVRPAADT